MVIFSGRTKNRACAVAFVARSLNFSISNMAEQKVSTDSDTLEVTHNELKDIIKKKAKEKGWDEKEENDFVSSLLKVCVLKIVAYRCDYNIAFANSER